MEIDVDVRSSDIASFLGMAIYPWVYVSFQYTGLNK